MAGIATLGVDETLLTLRAEWLYTYARLVKSPHAKIFASECAAMGPVTDAAIVKQSSLDDATVMAAAARDAADEALDPVVLQIIATILLITKGDRYDPLYMSYVGDQTGAQMVKPVLGQELEMASDWVEILKAESDPNLQAFAVSLAEVVALGIEAQKAVKESDKALSDFRLIGDRKKAVDTLNSARAILHGKLVQFQHDHPELRLGSGWAGTFFRRSTKTGRYGTTVSQIEEYIAALDADRAQAMQVLQDAKDKLAQVALDKQSREKARAELAELRQVIKTQRAQEKALEAKVNRKRAK